MNESNETIEQRNLHAVTFDGNSIRYIDNPSEAVRLAAADQNGYAIEYILSSSEAVRMVAVLQQPHAIQYIGRPSEDIQIAAVTKNGYAVQYLKKPSEEVQLAAVRQAGCALAHIKNPSEAVCLEALRENLIAFPFCPSGFRPSPEVFLEAMCVPHGIELRTEDDEDASVLLERTATRCAILLSDWTPQDQAAALDRFDPKLRSHPKLIIFARAALSASAQSIVDSVPPAKSAPRRSF